MMWEELLKLGNSKTSSVYLDRVSLAELGNSRVELAICFGNSSQFAIISAQDSRADPKIHKSTWRLISAFVVWQHCCHSHPDNEIFPIRVTAGDVMSPQIAINILFLLFRQTTLSNILFDGVWFFTNPRLNGQTFAKMWWTHRRSWMKSRLLRNRSSLSCILTDALVSVIV